MVASTTRVHCGDVGEWLVRWIWDAIFDLKFHLAFSTSFVFICEGWVKNKLIVCVHD